MHRLFRHFLAWLTCLIIFSLTGTADGFGTLILTGKVGNPGVSMALTGLVNVALVAFICLVVLMPITVIVDYLFTQKWAFSWPVQVMALVPLLAVYLVPWSFFFGRLWLVFLWTGVVGCALPLLVYWAVFKVSDRDYGN